MRILLRILGVVMLLALALPAQAHTGFGIVVDREGRIVFLDAQRSKVWRIEKDGKLVALAGGMHGNTLVQDPQGNLYFQNFNDSLWRLAPHGKLERVPMPAQLAADGRFGSLGELLAVDAQGNLFATGGNDFYPGAPVLMKITPAGEVTVIAGSTPGQADGRGTEAQFQQIRSAAWGPDGALYVADANSVRRVSLEGQVTTLAGSSGVSNDSSALENGPWVAPKNPAGFRRVYGIALDAQRNAFAADSDNFRIVRISPDGRVTTIRETHFPWKPAGVAVASGRVYSLELKFVPIPVVTQWFHTHRVVEIGSAGQMKTVANVGGDGGYVLSVVLAGLVLGTWQLGRRIHESIQKRGSKGVSL